MNTKEIKQLVRAAQLAYEFLSEASEDDIIVIEDDIDFNAPIHTLEEALNNFPNKWKGENWDQEHLKQFNIYDSIGNCITNEPVQAETADDAVYTMFITENGNANVTEVETEDID